MSVRPEEADIVELTLCSWLDSNLWGEHRIPENNIVRLEHLKLSYCMLGAVPVVLHILPIWLMVLTAGEGKSAGKKVIHKWNHLRPLPRILFTCTVRLTLICRNNRMICGRPTCSNAYPRFSNGRDKSTHPSPRVAYSRKHSAEKRKEENGSY